MTAADCVKHKWLQQHPAATPTKQATAAGTPKVTKSATVSSKTRLKSESPTPLASESSEDSTETIEDADDDEDEATEQDEESEELAQLCNTHELEVSRS